MNGTGYVFGGRVISGIIGMGLNYCHYKNVTKQHILVFSLSLFEVTSFYYNYNILLTMI